MGSKCATSKVMNSSMRSGIPAVICIFRVTRSPACSSPLSRGSLRQRMAFNSVNEG